MHDPSIIVKEGKLPGRTVTVMGGVHGNEPCGVEAVQRAVREIEIKRGKVYFIIANLAAIEHSVRQTDMNLNRAFRPEATLTEKERGSYERKRALELMPYLDESEALLDIHSSMSKESIPFIICEPHSFGIAKKLPFPIRSHGWDAIEPGGTDSYMNRRSPKGNGICIECGYHLDPEAPKRAFDSIQVFLRLMDIIDGESELQEYRQREIDACFIYHTTENFEVAEDFADFQRLGEDELVGYDGRRPVYAPFDGVIIFARNRETAGEEAFIMGKEG